MGQLVRAATINELSGRAFTVASFRVHRITTASDEEWKRQRAGPAKSKLPHKLLEADLQSLTGLCLDRVRTREESAYWNGLIDEYHYLGYKPLPGAGKVFDSLGRGRLRSHRLFRIGMESGRSRPVDRLGCVDSREGFTSDREQRAVFSIAQYPGEEFGLPSTFSLREASTG